MRSDLEWDELKDRANRAKHGIGFEEAVSVFDGPVLSAVDDREDYGEDRWVTVGLLEAVVVIVVVHTDRDGKTRLISARKANRKERRTYYEHLERTVA